MEKTKKLNHWRLLTVGVVLAAALTGLLVINIDRVAADKAAAPAGLYRVADESQETAMSGDNAYHGGSVALSTVKMVSALAVVLVCIYLGIYLLKRMMGRRYAAGGGNGILQVLETAYVGPKKTVSLIRVAERSVLIGVTDNQISMLTELGAEETAALSAGNIDTTGEGFNQLFKSAIERFKKISPKKNRAVLEN
ncbi:MAG: flagellar biosynthetic protein FliO [candidate division Zixibacteria bacterium]|nr:flagellar biosynthetic protein FliO [candidate division Zixibacteria bacterium]MDD5425268.1 flagellar biosynthetic protein FliO [candidate division Zixibacteria bacterium]